MTAPLEGHPTDAQKSRLEDWLTELKIICARYRLILDTDDEEGGETRVIDVERGTTIGIGVHYLIGTKNGRRVITAYDCNGSILDGVWLVDTDTGMREQRSVGRVYPAPDTLKDPT